MNAPSTPHLIDASATLRGKQVLFCGATGFLGKVTLSMLLHRYGDALARVLVLVRKGNSRSALERFFEEVVQSEPFRPIREKYGDAEARAWFEKKCTVLEGDIAQAHLGLSDTQRADLAKNVDVVINSAGLVSFNPPLEMSLNVNTLAMRTLAACCVEWDAPLVHVSTAFVAGSRSGLIFEDEELVGFFPKRATSSSEFSLERELSDCEKLVARLRADAEDSTKVAEFRARAIERLRAEGRDPTDPKSLRLAEGRERKVWLTNRLVEAGTARARHWGWPNTYTYAKSLGEQVLASTPGLHFSIARPSIVESAMQYPFPGWNEGFNTSAPLIYSMLSGLVSVPAGNNAILDIIPVDMVAGAIIAMAVRQVATPERRVYQLASGDTMPFEADRSVELVGLYKRRLLGRKKRSFLTELERRSEPTALSKRGFELFSSPIVAKGSRWLQDSIDAYRPRWGAPRLDALLTKARDKLGDVAAQSERLVSVVELFLPFCWDDRLVFRCDNTRTLIAAMSAPDRVALPWCPETIDWRTYFLESHLPGLEKWVFPALDEERDTRRTVRAYRDLVELFEASVHAWRHRVAFRMYEGTANYAVTYGEVHTWSARVAGYLGARGWGRGDRVVLLSENRPEWGGCFFGIAKTAATVVPVDKDLSQAEILNIVRRSRAVAVVASDRTLAARPALAAELAALNVHLASQADVLSHLEVQAKPVPLTPDDVAALIFTSGTTATPKGVVLTHRNFTSLVAKLSRAFELGVGDGVLSVLPLHHTFEFSAGFLTPLSAGCSISYLDELTAENLAHVLRVGNISALVGVPAVWQHIHRSFVQGLDERPQLFAEAVRALMSLNEELRSKRDRNLGKLLFWPVHRKLGGHLRVLVSGGSALPETVHQDFYALGFNLDEGYGLAEAAPVLSVTRAGNKRIPGTVGRALPGIEIKIDSPDEDGVGEVIARGPNVMAGYFEDADATASVLKGGWLHTGDLGRLDDARQLYLVGRKKDVIIDANGKNAYPDEIEELYRSHPRIRDLAVVGLPDARGIEKVACLCVVDLGGHPIAEVLAELDAHFRAVSAELPIYRRIKLWRFTHTELPRTSTRKVKRPLVVEELKRLERETTTSVAQSKDVGEARWITAVLAEVAQIPVSKVLPSSNLQADLGFDSLMLAELAAAIAAKGVKIDGVDFTQVATVDELQRVLSGATELPTAVAAPNVSSRRRTGLSRPLLKLGGKLLSLGTDALYEKYLSVSVTGTQFIPPNRNVLVIANHASHLDMGLVKHALGEHGDRLVALAAKDYFFDTRVKRAFFENFTNLIPMERKGSLRESLKLACDALAQGYNLLIFPEGTRTPDGSLQPFKPTVGYLALTCNVDVLPMYLRGTFDAFPRGNVFPRRAKLEVNIGPPVQVGYLLERKGMSRATRYRVVTTMTEAAVRALSQGRVATREDLQHLAEGAPARRRRAPLATAPAATR